MSARPTSVTLADEEHRKKRVRKGTKSCWECKRRKVKCQLSSENVSVCSGCLSRGTTCISQEYPEEHDSSGGPQIGERLGRIELTLDKLMAKLDQYDEQENATKIHTPESMGTGDVLTPFPHPTSTGYNSATIAPILSLFDNAVLGRREKENEFMTSKLKSNGEKSTNQCRPLTKVERIRDVLIELLPSQEATNKLCSFSDSWLLMHSLSQHSPQIMLQPTGFNPNHSFNIPGIGKESPATIAQTLLYVAVCLQQVPHGYDASQLGFNTSIQARTDKIISTVSGLVTSDDELVACIQGLECLMLLGLFHMNAGNLRRSWLTFRRGMNIGQLMGLHRREEFGSTALPPGGIHLWRSLMQADRYLSLLLGMPAGAGDCIILPHETFSNPNINHDLLFIKKITNLAGGILERNQSEHIHAFATTQELDEKLENIGREMPSSWWDIPDHFETISEKTNSAAKFDRIMSQIYYFQLQSFLHLPFMVRADTERRYEYSKFACMKSSRECISRYLAIRRSGAASFCCRVIDFGAFTACVTLLLSILETPPVGGDTIVVQDQKCSDRKLVETVLDVMSECASAEDVMAIQSVEVIKTLLSSTSTSGNLRLTIPYFGTISIARTPKSSTATNVTQSTPSINTDQPSLNTTPALMDMTPRASAQAQNEFVTAVNSPWAAQQKVSFKSSQFPPLELEQQFEDWPGLHPDNTMFFDSLLNTDLEANWYM
ncbi:5fe09b89-7443-4cbe-881c-131efb4b48bf [Sclerotinia trifoliorum]|uniref:5fe09b89-7443-4cbe-881c-131efb4b48bf n=1 Tax=Sclerotinia trifoliorum TaxID=28548 RepID=A0A8H2ZSV2_9HELO|nr:5fe09b89-7443-4cbe-881c-131efb4b48bf [Sclerotinia trifoliorum]